MYQITRVKKGSVTVDESKTLDGVKLSKGDVLWVNKVAKTQEELEEVRDLFGFHSLAIEDCVDRQQRPKIDIFDDYVLVIVKDLELKDNLVINQLGLFIGKDYLVTISNKPLDEVESVIKRLQTNPVKHHGSEFLAYRILDRIVDSYFPILDGIEDDIEAVEKRILRNPNDRKVAERIFQAKRNLLLLRKATWPAREVFSTLSKGELPNISKRSRVYYRDIYDHVVLVIDLVETYRDLVAGILETHLSAISNSMNEVMKVLTVIATIFIPLTFITGLYGMNFRFMPEIGWEYGYAFALLLMLIIGLGMAWYFKKKGWV